MYNSHSFNKIFPGDKTVCQTDASHVCHQPYVLLTIASSSSSLRPPSSYRPGLLQQDVLPSWAMLQMYQQRAQQENFDPASLSQALWWQQ